jgi:hypothetical protein
VRSSRAQPDAGRTRRVRPGVGWELEQQPDGTYDVRHAGRAAVRDRDGLAEAIAYVLRSRDYQPDEPVVHVDLTGYREVLH